MAVTEVAGIGHGVGFKPVKETDEVVSGVHTQPLTPLPSIPYCSGSCSPPCSRCVLNARVAQHHSSGKPKFGLVPPRALEQMAIVMTQAEAKYPPHGHTPNYLIGNGFDPRDYIESALRHLNACVRGEQLNDTGMHHLAHAAIDAAIALELMYHRGDHK